MQEIMPIPTVAGVAAEIHGGLDDAGSLEQRLAGMVSGLAQRLAQDQQSLSSAAADPALVDQPERLQQLQVALGDHSIRVGLASTLVRKMVGTVETLMRG